MKLIKCLILLLLVYEVASEHKKKKHNTKCHKRQKCCKRHKEVPHVEEVHHLSGKHEEESTNPFHKENFFISVEKDFAVFQQFFKPNVREHPDHFDLTAQKPKEHDGLLDNKFLKNEQIHKDFIDEHEDTHSFLKNLLNKFFKMLFEKHFNHNQNTELNKNSLIDHLDDDCKNYLKLLIGKCFETDENKDYFKKILELPLKDVIDKENMNHLHSLFNDHENKEHILDYLLKLPLNAILNHKITEYIFEKDLGNHEDILENLLKLHLTDIFEIKEHLVPKIWFEEKQIHKEFIDEDEDTHSFLKKLLNTFFKMLFEKHFNHNQNKELNKNPLIDHLDDDCKNSLKLLIGKCFETVENKECFKKILELPLKDVIDKENMNHLRSLFNDHENKEHILDYLLKFPLTAVLNHKITEYIFEKDLGNHEDILENLLKLHLTDIFEIKEHLVPKILFDEKLSKLPQKIDHLGQGIHSALEHIDEDKDHLFKFLVGKDIIEKEVKEDISKNILETLFKQLIIAKKMLIEQEKTKFLKELIEHSVKAHIKDHINHEEQIAVKALLIKLGEDILIKSILKGTIERSVKDNINHDQFAVKALLTTLMGEDILINSILKETVEHSQINEKELLPKHIENNDKQHEVEENMLKLMILKHLLSHQNKPEEVLKETVEYSQINEKELLPKHIEENDKEHEVKEKLLKLMILLSQQNNPEEVPIQNEETNSQNSFKRNDDVDLDFDKLKEQLQKLIIPEQANPVESYISGKSVDPIENRYIIDIPASPEEPCIIDIPAGNPVESFIIDTPSEYAKDIDKYADLGLWDYYYNQYAHFIDEKSDEEICIGCVDDDENVYYTYEQ